MSLFVYIGCGKFHNM